MYRLLINANVLVKNGAFRELTAFVRAKGYKAPGILIDEGFGRSPLGAEFLAKAGAEFDAGARSVFSSGAAEPTYDSLEATVEQFRGRGQDVILGIGGGSCMDTAKAVAALLTNPGPALDYRGFDKLQRPGVPTILVPTTAGTGSEVSFNASFVDTKSNRKMGINGNHMFAAHAILDAETTLSCPYTAALSAGVDALVHTLEGFICKQATPLSDMLAREAFRLLVNAMPCLKDDPQCLEKRLDLLVGAMLGGIIQMNSGSGVAAAISYPLSVYYKVPHGIGGGLSCVDMVQFNIDHAFYKYAELATLIGVDRRGASDRENAQAVCDHLRALWSKLKVPRKLSAFGIGTDKHDHMLKIMETQQPGFDQNPVPFTVAADLPSFLGRYF